MTVSLICLMVRSRVMSPVDQRLHSADVLGLRQSPNRREKVTTNSTTGLKGEIRLSLVQADTDAVDWTSPTATDIS